MTKLRRHLLERSPEETSRRLCLALLDEASSALDRMDDPEDSEALHDFRVSLRRLRSLMRAYRPYLRGSAAKKHRKRLKALAASTNLARDAEVQIEWLETARDELGELGVTGADHLISELEARQSSAPSPDTLRREFRPLRRDLKKALSRLRLTDDQGVVNFVQATAELLRDHAKVLAETLAPAHSAEDTELLHRARIEAKRLRYILEPLRHELEDARRLVKGLKFLQDILGELQDTRVMTETISEALESSALDEARKLRDLALTEGELPEAYPPRNPGLLALLKVQRTRRDRAFTELTRTWTGNAGEVYFRTLEAFIERLARWSGEEVPQRRFLLSDVPAEIRDQKAQHVREGWLPGRTISERLRAIRDGRSIRYERIVQREGVVPAEEELTRRTFDELWSPTEGRRLEYRRYELVDGARRWNVIHIPDHGIVLAVTEATDETPIPSPIQREVLREVTGMKKYEPEALARAGSSPDVNR